jgi:hypothetical protein
MAQPFYDGYTETKICVTCDEERPIDEFHWATNKDRPNRYRRSDCKYCRSEKSKEYHRSKRGQENYFQRTYNISLVDWDRMFHEQEGTCAICNEEFGDKICVDHNHETKEVRGLLCERCNILVGYLESFEDLLQSANDYIGRRILN